MTVKLLFLLFLCAFAFGLAWPIWCFTNRQQHLTFVEEIGGSVLSGLVVLAVATRIVGNFRFDAFSMGITFGVLTMAALPKHHLEQGIIQIIHGITGLVSAASTVARVIAPYLGQRKPIHTDSRTTVYDVNHVIAVLRGNN